MSDLLERLSSEVILADGAMGTMLHGRGVSFDKCFDELNLSNPEAVANVTATTFERARSWSCPTRSAQTASNWPSTDWTASFWKSTGPAWTWLARQPRLPGYSWPVT